MSAQASDGPRMIRLLGSLSLVCGLLIVVTHQLTLRPIRDNQEIILRETVAELAPGVRKQVIYGIEPSGELSIRNDMEGDGKRFIAAYDGSGALLGILIEESERGYADIIRAMYVYSPSKQAIIGFKVVELKETPGLGDRIASDRGFLANFQNLDAKLNATGDKLAHAITAVRHGRKKNPWEVDAISGATISSRAAARGLMKSAEEMLPVIARNRNRIERGE